jgi:hypothetical protein
VCSTIRLVVSLAMTPEKVRLPRGANLFSCRNATAAKAFRKPVSRGAG